MSKKQKKNGRPENQSEVMIKDHLQLKAGALLISPPMQWDPNFRRTVVFLCEHSDSGSFGLILNRPLSLVMEQVFEDMEGFGEEIRWGGPVQSETLHFLHRIPEIITGGDEVLPGIFWGGDFEMLKAGVRTKQVHSEDVRFFLGYSGWSTGQLSGEIEEGGWIVSESNSHTIFETSESALWRESLLQKGGSYAVLANFPDHPTLN
ncbi:MAG: YqgE/AlgH family protein [Bacteroidetes Order II. Incertae sedis bacterium]|nr:YqgE/AlgH family protein [Bacteroidetes Order II. bacterium]